MMKDHFLLLSEHQDEILIGGSILSGFIAAIIVALIIDLRLAVCLGIAIPIFVFFYGLMLISASVRGEDYKPANRMAKKMKEVKEGSPPSIKDIPFSDKHMARLALKGEIRKAALVYAIWILVFTLLGAFLAGYFLSGESLSFLSDHMFLNYIILVLFFVPPAYIEMKRRLERALEILKKNEIDDPYYTPHVTFPLEKDR